MRGVPRVRYHALVILMIGFVAACDWVDSALVVARQQREATWHGYHVDLEPGFFLEQDSTRLVVYAKAATRSLAERASGPVVFTVRPDTNFRRFAEWCRENFTKCETRRDLERSPDLLCLDFKPGAELHAKGGTHGYYCRLDSGEMEARFTCQDEGCELYLDVVFGVMASDTEGGG
jgi:hypothetical protein